MRAATCPPTTRTNVALSREGADRPLSYGRTGQGSLFHLVTQKLLCATGARAMHVPYRGGVPLLTDLQGGVIDFTMLPVDALLRSMVVGGRMKVLGVASAQRLTRFPAAPTFDESRAAPALGRPSIWVGLLIPAATSEGVSHQLHKAVVDALVRPDVRKAIDVAGGSVPSPMSLADAARFYATAVVKLQALDSGCAHRAAVGAGPGRACPGVLSAFGTVVATLFFAILAPESASMRDLNAGHEAPRPSGGWGRHGAARHQRGGVGLMPGKRRAVQTPDVAVGDQIAALHRRHDRSAGGVGTLWRGGTRACAGAAG